MSIVELMVKSSCKFQSISSTNEVNRVLSSANSMNKNIEAEFDRSLINPTTTLIINKLVFTTTNRHGVAAFDFTTVSGCDQLVVYPANARGGTLDLLMTDVPDIVQVSVVAPMGNSDHSTLSVVISMAQAVPNLCVTRKVFLKHQVNWNTVCARVQCRIYPGVTFGLLTILLRF